MARRLTKEEFCDRTIVRWKQHLDKPDTRVVRRVAARDRQLVEFVYEQISQELYNVAFPDASEEEQRKEREKNKK